MLKYVLEVALSSKPPAPNFTSVPVPVMEFVKVNVLAFAIWKFPVEVKLMGLAYVTLSVTRNVPFWKSRVPVPKF